jgi:hypothetical protein
MTYDLTLIHAPVTWTYVSGRRKAACEVPPFIYCLHLSFFSVFILLLLLLLLFLLVLLLLLLLLLIMMLFFILGFFVESKRILV